MDDNERNVIVVEQLKDVNPGDQFLDEVNFDPDFSFLADESKSTVDLFWRDINLWIGKEHVLKGITGHASHSEVCAIIADKASGKASHSLLKVLAGRMIPTFKKRMSGDVFLNHAKVNPVAYRKKVGYVLEGNELFPSATVKEILQFSAKLRLGADLENGLVDDIINSLHLTKVAGTMAGSSSLKGLSASQRKRLAIGVELLMKPRILFLEEPTSGLDFLNEWKIVKLLNNLAEATHCSVICTLTEPPSAVFNLLHQVMMLSKGEVLFNGTKQQLLEVVRSAEKFVSVPNIGAHSIAFFHLFHDYEKLERANFDEAEFIHADNGKSLAPSTNFDGVTVKRHEWGRIWTEQKLLYVREVRNLLRDKAVLFASTLAVIAFNFVYAITFFNVGDKEAHGYTVSLAYRAVFMIMLAFIICSFQFPFLSLNRGVVLREMQAGEYSLAAYLLSRFMIEIPVAYFQGVVGLVVSYNLISFDGSFFYFSLVILLICTCCSSFAYALGTLVQKPANAPKFVPLILIPQLLFAGIFIPVKSMQPWIRWGQHVCVLQYALFLGALVEFEDCHDDVHFAEGSIEEVLYTINCTVIMQVSDIDPDNAYLYAVLIGAFALGFRALSVAALALRRSFYAN